MHRISGQKKAFLDILAIIAGLFFLVSWTPRKSLPAEEGMMLADRQDTVRKAVPDSLRSLLDSLKNIPDSLKSVPDTLKNVPDSLRSLPDSLSVSDSLAVPDSLSADSLSAASGHVVYTERELKKMYRDSVKAVRDSIRWAKPRILETGFLPDSLYYKRILVWNADPGVNRFKAADLDTTYNDWYTEYPFYKHQEVDVNYLGTVGSPVQSINFMRRREFSHFKAYEPYLIYSYTPEDMPFFNTKSPYTELGYWGTLFDYKDKEEINARFLHTQNITPELNFMLMVQKWSTGGILENETSKNNNFHVNLNYLGKRYVGHLGYIHQNINRKENGGIQDSKWFRDTTVDGKTVPINLKKANSTLSRNTVFVSHTYDFPLYRQQESTDTLPGNDMLPETDSLSLADSTSGSRYALGDGPTISLGHYGEISRFYRNYTDFIDYRDETGRNFYHDRFYIHPTQTGDSTRLFSVENRIFFNMQPWTRDAVVSRITGGIGHQWNNIYAFRPDMFLKGNGNIGQHNLYVYAGVAGQFRKYLDWYADARYHLLGYDRNNLEIKAGLDVSFYPFRDKSQPVTLTGKFSTDLKEPDWFSQHYYSNHYVWENNFSKVSDTRAEAYITVPKWKFELGFGYALVANHIYNDETGILRQDDGLISVMTGYLKKNFKIWYLRLDHEVLFQYSSRKEILPLPMFTFNFRYYFEFPAVKNVLTIQLGASATMNTLYHAPAYNPALGTFQLQHMEEIGNNPYIDVFVNLQWKNVSLFLKCINVGQGWPNGDMFSAYHYVKPYRTFKFGIHWPFYFK